MTTIDIVMVFVAGLLIGIISTLFAVGKVIEQFMDDKNLNKNE